MIRPSRLLLFLLFPTLLVLAQRQLGVRPTDSGGQLSLEQAAYNVLFYDLYVQVYPDKKAIEGELTMTALVNSPLEWLVMDLDNALTVHSIHLDRKPNEQYKRYDGQIRIRTLPTLQPGNTFSVTINYSGTPKEAPRPPWAGGFTWSKTKDGQPWIATSCQNDGADLWWPCKDHPSDEPDSMRIRIRVPSTLKAISNGKFIGMTAHRDNTSTWEWFVSTPVNNYGIALNIAPYKEISGEYQSVSGDKIPVTFWVLPENFEQGQKLFPQFNQHLAFFEKYLGPYPFRGDKYGVAHTPFLGMEHQSIIAYGSNFENNPEGYDVLHFHELGHEWWGNLVTAVDWSDFWLHEGLCAYMHALYSQELGGMPAYHQTIRRSLSQIRNIKPVAPRATLTTVEAYFVPPEYTTSDGDMWNKGIWVLHSLRYLLGDEPFFRALRRMAYPDPQMENVSDGTQCRFATTDDFRLICEQESGRQLDWFFEVYLRQAPLPVLDAGIRDGKLHMNWATMAKKAFEMPVDVLIDDNIVRVEMAGGSGSIKITPGSDYRIDPQQWILRAMPKE